MRFDDSVIMDKVVEGTLPGATALIVLGGASAAKWEALRDEVKPDVLIGVNGVNGVIPNLDFWLCTENMRNVFAHPNTERNKALAEMYQRTGARIRMVNFKSADYIVDQTNLIRIKRFGVDDPEHPGDFSFRNYGGGLITGSIYDDKSKASKTLRVGTVGLQSLHLAGILGCAEVHTIGFDLCFRGEHHFYAYPSYESDEVWNVSAFTTYKGLDTLYWWIETAKYMKKIAPLLRRDGIRWIDHSDGLLKIEGIAL